MPLRIYSGRRSLDFDVSASPRSWSMKNATCREGTRTSLKGTLESGNHPGVQPSKRVGRKRRSANRPVPFKYAAVGNSRARSSGPVKDNTYSRWRRRFGTRRPRHLHRLGATNIWSLIGPVARWKDMAPDCSRARSGGLIEFQATLPGNRYPDRVSGAQPYILGPRRS